MFILQPSFDDLSPSLDISDVQGNIEPLFQMCYKLSKNLCVLASGGRCKLGPIYVRNKGWKLRKCRLSELANQEIVKPSRGCGSLRRNRNKCNRFSGCHFRRRRCRTQNFV